MLSDDVLGLLGPRRIFMFAYYVKGWIGGIEISNDRRDSHGLEVGATT
jgi:hypothetical protein